MTSPVPVHFDGHNINIITEDSPSMCKDRTKSMSIGIGYRKKNKKRKKGNRNAKLAEVQSVAVKRPVVVGGSTAKSPTHSISYSLSPVTSNKDNERKDTASSAIKSGVSYKAKAFKDALHAAPSPPTAGGADRENDRESHSAAKSTVSPPKKQGINPNAKPFVMTQGSAQSNGAKNSTNKMSMSNTRHREDYQPPPRLQNRNGAKGRPLPRSSPSKHHPNNNGRQQRQTPRITDAQLIAQGFNPADFGSHDDEAFDEEHGDEQRYQLKGGKVGDRRNLFKTELCREWSTSGWCYYNKRCSFAHGLHELRPVFRSKKWRTKRCRNWHTTGYCPYEHRCQFLHDQSPPRRMTDYAQTNARAMAAAQQRLKPLYFHYQVDCERDTADGNDPAAGSDGRKSQKEATPGSSASRQGSAGLEHVDSRKLYRSVADRKEAAESDDAAFKKKKSVKNAVITPFTPSAAVYPAPSGGFEVGPVAAAPFQGYPVGAAPPSALSMVDGLSANQAALFNAINVPLPSLPAASPAMTAASLVPPLTAFPPSIDPTIYMTFTPSPENVMASDVHSTAMAAMPSLALPETRDAAAMVPDVEMPASLTPPPTTAIGAKYGDPMLLYNKMKVESARQQMAHQQHQRRFRNINQITMAFADIASSPSCGLDDAALMDLLPNDPFVAPRHGDKESDDQKENVQPPEDDDRRGDSYDGDGAAVASRPSASPAERSNGDRSANSRPSGGGDAATDDAKADDDGEEQSHLLSMAGILPPCPPALQLQQSPAVQSVDSVVWGAVNAAFLANASPAVQHRQSLQAAMAQQAHDFAHQHAAAAVQPSSFANYGPPHGSFAYNVPAAMISPQIEALRAQPPATLMTAAATETDSASATVSRSGGDASAAIFN